MTLRPRSELSIMRARPTQTQRLVLRPLSVDDAEVTFALDHAPGVNDYTGDTPSTTLDDERAWLSETSYLAVVERESGRLIGWCGLSDHELVSRLHPSACGKGYGTEAASAVVTNAFEDGARHIIADLDEANVPARRLVEKLDFVRCRPGLYVKSAPARST